MRLFFGSRFWCIFFVFLFFPLTAFSDSVEPPPRCALEGRSTGDSVQVVYKSSLFFLGVKVDIENKPGFVSVSADGQPLVPFASSTNTSNCEFYSFNYRGPPGKKFPYDTKLKKEEVSVENGKTIHTCYYGVPPRGFFHPDTQMCPEVLEGVAKECPAGECCPQEITCTLTLPEVNEHFGFLVKKDECGNTAIVPVNDGEPIDFGVISLEARKAIDACTKELQVGEPENPPQTGETPACPIPTQPQKTGTCTSKNGQNACCFDPAIEACENDSCVVKCGDAQLSCRNTAMEKWCCPIEEGGIYKACNAVYGSGLKTECVDKFMMERMIDNEIPKEKWQELYPELLEIAEKECEKLKCGNDYVSSFHKDPDSKCTVLNEITNADAEKFDYDALAAQMPPECTCQNSSIEIVGNNVIDPAADPAFYYDALANCNAIAKEKGSCTFLIVAENASDMKILSKALGQRFSHVAINSHGLPNGTVLGGSEEAGKLLCTEGGLNFFSCYIGTSPFFHLLGTPKDVVNVCKTAPAGTIVRASNSFMLTGLYDKEGKPYFYNSGEGGLSGIVFDRSQLGNMCVAGTPKCFECLESPKGWAKDVDCSKKQMPLGITRETLPKKLKELSDQLLRQISG